DSVHPLSEAVEVDYFLPGCPPPATSVAEAVGAIARGALPPKGSVLAGQKNLCQSCPRKKEEKRVKEFRRVHEFVPDPESCFLEQGMICAGPATRDGCGYRCIEANMPCRGCFGPAPDVSDQGTRLASAVATLVDSNDEAEIRRVVGRLADPVGTLYRFGVSSSILGGRRIPPGEANGGQRASGAKEMS
ncbi:MAG: hypothetical protein K6T75_10730, partial [Acetobacteraceae bacterium]|nr:hypothetical protein [Acetobacteraceae bacterium]